MLFSELYSAYYNAVAAILKEAVASPVSAAQITMIAKKYAFSESSLTITESLKNGYWPLLNDDNTGVVRNSPEMPLTLLQKRWLKAISNDPRIRLFNVEMPEFTDVEPLFGSDDFCVFDKYSDGDNYEDEQYITHFRIILDAIKNRYPLQFFITNRNDRFSRLTAQPEYIEYSEKDDKFRVGISGFRYGDTVNIGRILSCKRVKNSFPSRTAKGIRTMGKVVLEVTDDRNALERVLLHFAHFAKEAERIDENHYRITIEYDRDDEVEMVIRILSFGPMIKVSEPFYFRDLIKNRLLDQKNLIKSCE